MSNIKESTGSLLFSLAPYTKIPYEDIATLALRSIIEKSSVLRNAFTDLLCEHLNIPSAEDVCCYKTQVVGKKLERPDIVGFNDIGKEVLICEAKFYAALTGNQPDAYLERLRNDNGKGLVFLCPNNRITGLWKQISKGVRSDENCITVQGIRMGIVSWEELLERLTIVSDRNGAEMRPDIQELKVFCENIIDENTFIPFSEVDFGVDVAISISRYYMVMNDLRDLLCSKKEYGITQKVAGQKQPLHSEPQRDGNYYIYMVAKDCMPYIYFDKYAWQQPNSMDTPFWLALHNSNWDQDEGVKTYINSLPEEMRGKGMKGDWLIALEPPVGLERIETVQVLCDQVLSHIDGYKECLRRTAREK